MSIHLISFKTCPFVQRAVLTLKHKNIDFETWEPADPCKILDRLLHRVFDHGQGEHIVSVHLLKTALAVRDEVELLPREDARILVAALHRCANAVAAGAAEEVTRVSTDAYLSGMQTVAAALQGRHIPAGVAELAAAGGLSPAHLEGIGAVTVLDAHIASLSDTLADACGPDDGLRARVEAALAQVPLPGIALIELDS